MNGKPEAKVAKSYTLDPIVVTWVTKKAAMETIEASEKVSDSRLVNDILRKAMEKDQAKR